LKVATEITRRFPPHVFQSRQKVGSGKLEVGSWKLEVGSGKWEVESGKWEVESGKWEVGSWAMPAIWIEGIESMRLMFVPNYLNCSSDY
jgi:hypothetical protein